MRLESSGQNTREGSQGFQKVYPLGTRRSARRTLVEGCEIASNASCNALKRFFLFGEMRTPSTQSRGLVNIDYVDESSTRQVSSIAGSGHERMMLPHLDIKFPKGGLKLGLIMNLLRPVTPPVRHSLLEHATPCI